MVQTDSPDFRFSIRIPSSVLLDKETHSLGKFLEDLAPIEEKVLAVLVDVPSTITIANGREQLYDILASCTYHGYSTTVQFGNSSWYQDSAYHILKKHNAALVWSDNHPTTVVTSDFLYLRIGKVNQKLWIDKLKEASGNEIEDIIVVLESPAQANSFLKAMGLSEKKYHSNIPTERISPFPKQTRLRKWNGRVIMCVDLNAFCPSCEELRDPPLKEAPCSDND